MSRVLHPPPAVAPLCILTFLPLVFFFFSVQLYYNFPVMCCGFPCGSFTFGLIKKNTTLFSAMKPPGGELRSQIFCFSFLFFAHRIATVYEMHVHLFLCDSVAPPVSLRPPNDSHLCWRSASGRRRAKLVSSLCLFLPLYILFTVQDSRRLPDLFRTPASETITPSGCSCWWW